MKRDDVANDPPPPIETQESKVLLAGLSTNRSLLTNLEAFNTFRREVNALGDMVRDEKRRRIVCMWQGASRRAREENTWCTVVLTPYLSRESDEASSSRKTTVPPEAFDAVVDWYKERISELGIDIRVEPTEEGGKNGTIFMRYPSTAVGHGKAKIPLGSIVDPDDDGNHPLHIGDTPYLVYGVVTSTHCDEQQGGGLTK